MPNVYIKLHLIEYMLQSSCCCTISHSLDIKIKNLENVIKFSNTSTSSDKCYICLQERYVTSFKLQEGSLKQTDDL